MKQIWGASLLAVAMVAACGQASNETGEVEAAAPPAAEAEGEADVSDAGFEVTDYSDMANWLCHPDKPNDACDVDLSYTVVNADGTTEIKSFEADANPAIDCFYVYPTVSADEGGNSDLNPGDEELRVVEGQLARFGQECRLFAPMYRQITIPELRRMMSGQGFTADMAMRWSDVEGAWNDYVENYNDGRGVVIMGHSQGSSLIQELVMKDVVGTPMEDKVVSIMPLGMTTYVDADTGNFGPYPPCTSKEQTGCILSYVSFRSTLTPPDSSRFGVTGPDGRRALCVNPAEVSGDNGELDARLSANGWYGSEPAEFANGEGVTTPFASVPGLLTAKCVEGDKHTYLEVTVNGDPEDPRVDEINGDVTNADGSVNADWGLHLVDMHAAMGNLVTIVGAESDAWVAKQAAGETGAE